jgi:[acyl-carrier-protein] S-malonyltransferase
MKALLFPGQGSQIVGMGLDLYNNYSLVKKIFSEADERLGFKISKIILEGPDIELKLTKNTQPAILTVSYSIYSILKNEFNLKFDNYKYFAGHSLGEYSALVCANSLTFSDALYLLHERGKAMQEAVPVGKGAMLAVLGINLRDIEIFISKIKTTQVIEIANDNADGQIIISGDIEAIKKLQELLKNDKKKSILLPVSAPFHCSLMKPAADTMKNKINAVKFKDPNIEIITNVTARSEIKADNIKDLLLQQIYSKVRWRESILYMVNQGVNEFIEFGPGKVLSGLVKRITKSSKTININSNEDIKSFIK